MLRLLHVDDEPDLAELVAIAISLDPDFSLRHCSTGNDALMEVTAWKPDVLLIDYMLPGIDGPSVLAQLTKQGIAPTTVFLTARSSADDMRRMRESGATGVIEKPFDPMTLASRIRQIMSDV